MNANTLNLHHHLDYRKYSNNHFLILLKSINKYIELWKTNSVLRWKGQEGLKKHDWTAICYLLMLHVAIPNGFVLPIGTADQGAGDLP